MSAVGLPMISRITHFDGLASEAIDGC